MAVVLEVSDKVTNHHVGVTAWGNFEQRLDNDWSLPEFTTRHVEQKLLRSGVDFVVVNLDKAEREAMVGKKCFSGLSDLPKPECAGPLSRWLSSYQADAMLFVSSGKGQPGALGPLSFSELGLFTRGTKTPNITFPVTLIWLNLFTGDIKRRPTHSNPYACGIGKSQNRSPWVKDIGEQTIEDLLWLRPLLEAQIVQVIDDGLHKLGLVQTGAEGCTN